LLNSQFLFVTCAFGFVRVGPKHLLVTPYKWQEVLTEDKTHWALTIHGKIHDFLFVGEMNKLNWAY